VSGVPFCSISGRPDPAIDGCPLSVGSQLDGTGHNASSRGCHILGSYHGVAATWKRFLIQSQHGAAPCGNCQSLWQTGLIIKLAMKASYQRDRFIPFHGTSLSPDCRSGRGRPSASAAHVVLELLDELALFGQHGAGAIADGNESEDLLAFHHREMADAPIGDDLHALVHRMIARH
jgi:hypothetical protein